MADDLRRPVRLDLGGDDPRDTQFVWRRRFMGALLEQADLLHADATLDRHVRLGAWINARGLRRRYDWPALWLLTIERNWHDSVYRRETGWIGPGPVDGDGTDANATIRIWLNHEDLTEIPTAPTPLSDESPEAAEIAVNQIQTAVDERFLWAARAWLGDSWRTLAADAADVRTRSGETIPGDDRDHVRHAAEHILRVLDLRRPAPKRGRPPKRP